MTQTSAFVTLNQYFPTAEMKFISNYKLPCLLTIAQAFFSSATAEGLERDKNNSWKQGSPNNLLTGPCSPTPPPKKTVTKFRPLAPDKTERFWAAFKGQQGPYCWRFAVLVWSSSYTRVSRAITEGSSRLLFQDEPLSIEVQGTCMLISSCCKRRKENGNYKNFLR